MDEFFCQPCIVAMPAAKFWLCFLAVAALSVIALLLARRNFFKARLIEDMPTSRVRSASQGYVELAGTAISRGEDQIAPLTGEQCLWWRYTIERHQKSGKSSSWKTVDRGVSTSPFFMADDTGQCRIDPRGAEISSLHKKVWRGTTRLPDTATLTHKPGLLEMLNPVIGSGNYRYTEYLIKTGDPLYLLGHFVSDATGKRVLSIDQVAGQIIREWKKDFDNLLVTYDKDGNGSLDLKEWTAVQQAATVAARDRQLDMADEDIEHTLVKPEDSELPYLIDSEGQDALSRRFRWHAILGAAGFLAFGAAASWLFSSRFLG